MAVVRLPFCAEDLLVERVTVDNVARRPEEWVYLQQMTEPAGPSDERMDDVALREGDTLSGLTRDADDNVLYGDYSRQFLLRARFGEGRAFQWGDALPDGDALRRVAPGALVYSRSQRSIFVLEEIVHVGDKDAYRALMQEVVFSGGGPGAEIAISFRAERMPFHAVAWFEFVGLDVVVNE